MVQGKYRQEVFNVCLAQLLQERGVVTAPESVMRLSPEGAARMPDVLVDFRGLRTAIEGEVDDQPGAQERARESAARRVTEGVAHIAVAVVYPAELRAADFAELKGRLAGSSLQLAAVTEAGTTAFPPGTVDDLEAMLRQVFSALLQEDVVGRAVAILDEAVESFAAVAAPRKGWIGRMAEVLGIWELPQRNKEEE